MALTRKAKIITISTSVAVIAVTVYVYFHFFFIYSTGVNAGDINYFQQEGIVFKTYEGKMIQTGFKSNGNASSNLRSNELKFSVTDKTVADKLMRCSGKHVELRWKRYMGTLPWRGNSQFIATEVLAVD
ncbi:MAG: hypothetical protein AUK63_957 [bacterium P3]|nr:MAG: hypothetical protein AUK63_957 [bacterium P3]KWW41398.1 MAG: hypothetical protein F083_1145 [bacterium F083]